MGRMVKMLGVPALVLAVGLVAGFALGQRQGLAMGTEFLGAEVSGSLARHVEAASCVRVGDTDCALQVLDSMIDAAVVSLHAQPGQDQPRRPLSDAKLYRGVIPSAGPRAAAVQAALEEVPESESPSTAAPQPASSGLGRLVARSGG